MYYIHDFPVNRWQGFSTWWKLIKHFFYNQSLLDAIAHNHNDEYHSYFSKLYEYPKLIKFRRNLIIYDADMRIVNITDIKKDVGRYNPDREEPYRYRPRYQNLYYRYRIDPVPYTNGQGGCGRYYGDIKKNKNYAAKLQDFPGDSRARERILLAKTWSDELGPHSKQGRSWKKRKIKKQWMKHI